jgi:Rod binding domain-containing protein
VSTADLPLNPVSPADVLGPRAIAAMERLRRPGMGQDRAALTRAAKDFESVLLNKLLEEMSSTIGDSGLLSSPTGKQLQGMFWNFLAEDLARQGGLGLWKDLYRQFAGQPGQDGQDGATPPASVEQLL